MHAPIQCRYAIVKMPSSCAAIYIILLIGMHRGAVEYIIYKIDHDCCDIDMYNRC